MHQRQKKILDMLQSGRLEIRAAAAELGVAEMTVRRDLRELEARKLVLRVKGGAIPHPARYEPETGPAEGLDRKFALANALFQRLMPVDSIFIGTGSTTLAFAKVLARRNLLPMTVVTHSLPVAAALFRSRCKVILLGGELRTDSLDLTGPIAERDLEDYHVDWLISGCDGAQADFGFYTSDVSISNLEKKSLRIADHAAIIAGSGKFACRALTRFAPLEAIDLLVTDADLAPADQRKLRCAGLEILKV